MFAVIENTPGYLPEAEICPVERFELVQLQFLESVKELEEQGYEIISAHPESSPTWVYLQKDPDDLGRVVSIEVVEEEG